MRRRAPHDQRTRPLSSGYDPLSPPPPPRAGPLRTAWRFLLWTARTDPRRTGAMVAIQMVQGLVVPANVWVVRMLFQRAVDAAGGISNWTALLPWIAAWAIISGLQAAAWPLLDLLVNRLRMEMEDSLQTLLQDKAGRLRLEVFERADFYDILRRAREAARPGVFLNLMRSWFAVPGQTAALVALAAVVGSWSPWLFAATVVAAIPDPVVQVLQSRAAFFLDRGQTPRARLRGYIEQVLTSRESAKEVRLFGLQEWLLDRWRNLFWSVADEQFSQLRAQNLAGAAATAAGAVGVAGGVALAVFALLHGSLQAGQFAAMLVALKGVQNAVAQMMHAFGRHVGDLTLKVADLFVYLDLGPEEVAGGLRPTAGAPGDITLQAVSFRYPQRTEPALRNITCMITAGSRVGLVGENGSGKTTLVKVLTGLYQPTEGRVLYGGLDLAALDPAAIRDMQAAVFQDHVRYAFSLADNVGYGKADRAGDRGAVREAAVRGGADMVADQLPQGYDTMLTQRFTGGTDLSGGQWQRVAISRGFMREAPLMVLDEPTAALDPRAEAEVFRRFTAMAGGGTAVLVSHRLGFAKLCDRVLVLRDGGLVEDGTHDDLVAAGGDYAQMWATQSQWYR